MGYTHYWGFNSPERKKGAADAAQKAYVKAVEDCQRVIRAYQRQAGSAERLSGYSAHTKIGKYAGIQLNGKGDLAHESFDLREHFRQAHEANGYGWVGRGSNFCKTARKPYDIVVVACLCILKYRLRGLINVGSDGDQQDWQAGAGFAAHVLKRKIEVPKSIRAVSWPTYLKGGVK